MWKDVSDTLMKQMACGDGSASYVENVWACESECEHEIKWNVVEQGIWDLAYETCETHKEKRGGNQKDIFLLCDFYCALSLFLPLVSAKRLLCICLCNSSRVIKAHLWDLRSGISFDEQRSLLYLVSVFDVWYYLSLLFFVCVDMSIMYSIYVLYE